MMEICVCISKSMINMILIIKNHHFDLITKINLFYEKINYCDENRVRCKVLRLRWKFILVRWKFSIVIEIQYCDGNYFWWNLFIVMSGVNLGIKTISAKLKLSWQYSKLKLRNARLFCPLRSWKRNKFSDLSWNRLRPALILSSRVQPSLTKCLTFRVKNTEFPSLFERSLMQS